jgi:hypothetical protein
MKFLFDCDDEILLPNMYALIDEIKPFIDTMKSINVDEKEVENGKNNAFKTIMKKLMVEAPKETSKMLSKLWVLEEDEKAPNAFKTMTAIFESEAAIDFFVSALPSLLQILKGFSPLLTAEN